MTPDEKVALINDGVRVMLRHGNTADAVEAIVDMVLDEVKTDATIYEALAERGITRERLQKAMDSSDPWGAMVNAVEYLTVLNAVLRSWPTALRSMLDGYDPVPGLVARGVMSNEHDTDSCEAECCVVRSSPERPREQ